MTNGNKKKIHQDASEEEIIQLSRDAGIRWIVAGESGKLGVMHLLSFEIVDVSSGKPVISKNEDEPGSIEILCNTVVKKTGQEFISLIESGRIKTEITVTKPHKSNKTIYILPGILGAVGVGATAAAGAGGGGGGGTVTPPASSLPGPPTGPPTR